GALAGCGLCGFFLIEHLGITGTNRLAAATNVMLAIAAAALARSAPEATKPIHETANPAPALRLSDATAGLVLLSAGLAGFVSLAAEVLWTRALLRYLYNSTYAFTAMLVTFLLGIAIGSAVYTGLLARRRQPLVWLAMLQVGVAAGFLASVAVFPKL